MATQSPYTNTTENSKMTLVLLQIFVLFLYFVALLLSSTHMIAAPQMCFTPPLVESSFDLINLDIIGYTAPSIKYWKGKVNSFIFVAN